MRTFVAFLVVAAALAGCSDAPASGEFTADRRDIPVEASITVVHTPRSGQNPLGGVPGVGGELECLQDNSPEPDPSGTVAPCTEASSDFTGHFMELPELVTGEYKVVLTGGAGEVDLGAVSASGMSDFEAHVQGDVTDRTTLELRYGDLVVATAPATAGQQAFAVSEDLLAIQVAGEFKGKSIDLNITGLPEGTSYEGWLVTVVELDEGLAPEKTHAVSFEVANGQATIEVDEDVADYQEFHVHVAGTKVNVAIAAIE